MWHWTEHVVSSITWDSVLPVAKSLRASLCAGWCCWVWQRAQGQLLPWTALIHNITALVGPTRKTIMVKAAPTVQDKEVSVHNFPGLCMHLVCHYRGNDSFWKGTKEWVTFALISWHILCFRAQVGGWLHNKCNLSP